MLPDKVRQVLEANGLQAIEFEEGSTPTSVLAAGKLGVAVGNIAKSLLFLGKDGCYRLLVCPGDRKVSNSKLKAALGVKSRMATPEETLVVTGFKPGGVCPFGLEGIEILLDSSLADYGTLYPAAGTDSSGVPLDFPTLQRITAGRLVDCTDLPL